MISAHNIYPTSAHKSFIPSNNLSIQLFQQDQHKNSDIPLIKIKNIDSSEYNEIHKQIEEMKTKEKLPEDLSIHDIHHYTILYTLILFIILSSIYYRIKNAGSEINHANYFK